MDQSITSGYQEIFEKLESLERDIQNYQEFLGSVQTSFDECRDGCRDRFNGGRVLDADYIKSSHVELVEDDGFIDTVLEGEITSSEVRELTVYCKGKIAEMRERRSETVERKDRIEKRIAYHRNPEMDFFI